MEQTQQNKSSVTRRKLLSTLGLLFAFGATAKTTEIPDSYTEVIDKDGKLIRVPDSVLKQAKVVKSKTNNRDMFNWLRQKKS